jgi:CBS-domain-containing membrane protein
VAASSDPQAVRRGAQWPSAIVDEVMSRPVLTIDATETLWDAWQLLSISGLRHLAVLEDERCIGVISDRNILSDIPVSEQRMRARLVGELISRRVARSVNEGEHLAEVARTMAGHSIEAVPVLDAQSRLVGIVTGSDLVRWWAQLGT